MREDFELQLNERPDEWELRLIYADWLEGEGDELGCRCQRWMVEHLVAPYHKTNAAYLEQIRARQRQARETGNWWESNSARADLRQLRHRPRESWHFHPCRLRGDCHDVPKRLFGLLLGRRETLTSDPLRVVASYLQRVDAEADLAQALARSDYSPIDVPFGQVRED